jgi:hypothetical protein
MKPLNLVAIVTNILFRKVSDEEAKEFALKNFGELCAYIRAEQVRYLLSQRKQKAVFEGRVGSGRLRKKFFGGNAVDKRPSRTSDVS